MPKRKNEEPGRTSSRGRSAWSPVWSCYLAGEISAESLVNEALAMWEKEIEFLDAFIRKANEESPLCMPLEEADPKFRRFTDLAREELIKLTKSGTNPAVAVSLIVEDDWWHPLGIAQACGDYERELVKLSNPNFWKRVVGGLEHADHVLGDVTNTKLARIAYSAGRAAPDYPMTQLLGLLAELHKAFRRRLRLIDRLNLTRKGRSLHLDGFLVEVESSSPLKAAGRRGRIPTHEWEICAFRLWRYFTVRLSRPGWPSIARLLYYSGEGSFYGVDYRPERHGHLSPRTKRNEVDRVQARVNALRKQLGEDAHDLYLRRLEEDYGAPEGAEVIGGNWIPMTPS